MEFACSLRGICVERCLSPSPAKRERDYVPGVVGHRDLLELEIGRMARAVAERERELPTRTHPHLLRLPHIGVSGGSSVIL